jgi:hypothetical protein
MARGWFTSSQSSRGGRVGSRLTKPVLQTRTIVRCSFVCLVPQPLTRNSIVSEHDQLSVDNTNLTNLLMLLKHQDIPQELVDYLKACNKTLSESITLKTDGSEDEIDLPRLTSLLLASLEHSKKARLEEESRTGLILNPSLDNILCEASDPEWAKGSSDIVDADGKKLPRRIVRSSFYNVALDMLTKIDLPILPPLILHGTLQSRLNL